MPNSKCDRGIRFLACCKEETKTEFGVRKRKTEQEDDSGRVILETWKKKKRKGKREDGQLWIWYLARRCCHDKGHLVLLSRECQHGSSH